MHLPNGISRINNPYYQKFYSKSLKIVFAYKNTENHKYQNHYWDEQFHQLKQTRKNISNWNHDFTF